MVVASSSAGIALADEIRGVLATASIFNGHVKAPVADLLRRCEAALRGDVAQPPMIRRSSEADAYFKILQTIARFPITDPKNMDAVNMRLIAEGALAVTSTEGK